MFIATGEFFWNSGMFLWSVDSIINAIRNNAPDIAEQFDTMEKDFGTLREMESIKNYFESCPNISIDFAVMEKAPNVYVQCVNFGWNDLGTWSVLHDYSPKNRDGNVTQNCKALLYDCKDNMIAVKRDKLVVASGLKDYIVADADDVLLICPKCEEQRIRQYVNDVKASFGDKYL